MLVKAATASGFVALIIAPASEKSTASGSLYRSGYFRRSAGSVSNTPTIWTSGRALRGLQEPADMSMHEAGDRQAQWRLRRLLMT